MKRNYCMEQSSPSPLLELPSTIFFSITPFFSIKEYVLLWKTVCTKLSHVMQVQKKGQCLRTFPHIITRFDVAQTQEALAMLSCGICISKLTFHGAGNKMAHELGYFDEQKVYNPLRHVQCFLVFFADTIQEIELIQMSVWFFHQLTPYPVMRKITSLRWESMSGNKTHEEFPPQLLKPMESLKTFYIQGLIEHVLYVMKNISVLAISAEKVTLDAFGLTGRRYSPDTPQRVPELIAHFFPQLKVKPIFIYFPISTKSIRSSSKDQKVWAPNPHLVGTCSCFGSPQIKKKN